MKSRLTLLAVISMTVFLVGLTLAYADQTSARAATARTEDNDAALAADDVQQAARAPDATGNLSVWKYSVRQWGGAAPGRPITYMISYGWSGDDAAPNVSLTDELPPQVIISATAPPADSQSGQTLVWDLGTLENWAYGTIVITGLLEADIVEGTVFTNTATIDGDVTDEDPSDNVSEVAITVVPEKPDLWLWKLGLFEELEEGFFFTAEEGVETTFNLWYFNWSFFASPETTLVDALPEGIEYVSANPTPDDVADQQLTWELGTVPGFGFGEVTINVRPIQTGTFSNTAWLTNTIGDREPADNRDAFEFDVVPLLPPRLLKPNAQGLDSGQVLIVGQNPTFEGLAKAGATVTLYEGAAEGCFGDFSTCNPTALVSTTAGSDRHWTLTPTTMTETRTYSLYLRAELGGYASEPPFGFWSPLAIKVDPAFEEAGWDMDNFVIETPNQENRPGGLGGSTGTTPNEPFTITIRQDIWDTVPTSPTLRAYHDLRLVITEGGGEPYSMTLPASEFRPVTADAAPTPAGTEDTGSILDRMAYDIIYVQKGFGAGAHIEIWCRPIFYPDDPDGIPLVGLVWTLCNEILVDPAGYVYDVNTAGGDYVWPDVPPENSLITNATVTATVRTGDNSFERWEAEQTGQVNPQLTDYTTPDGIKVPGYYAFYVPSGQYRVLAKAPGCTPYASPILTVIDEPIFHNIGMRCNEAAQVGVRYDLYLPVALR